MINNFDIVIDEVEHIEIGPEIARDGAHLGEGGARLLLTYDSKTKTLYIERSGR